ncbi:MAG: hypothetical protein NTW14_10055, partial [bacterium]|nr:hypothetical protein [bacterium]
PGMSATADIITEVREDALQVPIQCIVLKMPKKEAGKDGKADSTVTDTTKKGEVPGKEKLIEVVFRMANGKAEQVPVTTGISSDTDTEVISGLAEGDVIVTGPFRTLTQKLKDGDAVKEKKETPFSGAGESGSQATEERGSGS